MILNSLMNLLNLFTIRIRRIWLRMRQIKFWSLGKRIRNVSDPFIIWESKYWASKNKRKGKSSRKIWTFSRSKKCKKKWRKVTVKTRALLRQKAEKESNKWSKIERSTLIAFSTTLPMLKAVHWKSQRDLEDIS